MHDGALIVQTVRGRISAENLGITLPHEHLLRLPEWMPRRPTPPDAVELSRRHVSLEIFSLIQIDATSNYDNITLDSPEMAIEELGFYKRAGGVTLVECTTERPRNPTALRRIAERSGINVVMGTGFYVADFHPPELEDRTPEQIADIIIDEFRDGMDGTGIRPGIIGEIGCSWPLHPQEANVLQGAAMAQSHLGCGLTVHPGRHPDAPAEILRILREGGADISRVVIGHIERTVQSLDGLKVLADTGCFIEYDFFGTNVTERNYRDLGIDMPSDAQRIAYIRDLAAAGYGSRLLMSHDICNKSRTRRFGGPGYDYILRSIVPWMRQKGFAESLLNEILIDNPRSLLAMVPA